MENLEKLEHETREFVKEKLQMLQAVENPLFFAKKLKGRRNYYRFRVGNYRIIFRLEKGDIFLVSVMHRKDVYENF